MTTGQLKSKYLHAYPLILYFPYSIHFNNTTHHNQSSLNLICKTESSNCGNSGCGETDHCGLKTTVKC